MNKELLSAAKLALKAIDAAIENAKENGDNAFIAYALTRDVVSVAIAKAEAK